jgi:hypothetical protein
MGSFLQANERRSIDLKKIYLGMTKQKVKAIYPQIKENSNVYRSYKDGYLEDAKIELRNNSLTSMNEIQIIFTPSNYGERVFNIKYMKSFKNREVKSAIWNSLKEKYGNPRSTKTPEYNVEVKEWIFGNAVLTAIVKELGGINLLEVFLIDVHLENRLKSEDQEYKKNKKYREKQESIKKESQSISF